MSWKEDEISVVRGDVTYTVEIDRIEELRVDAGNSLARGGILVLMTVGVLFFLFGLGGVYLLQ